MRFSADARSVVMLRNMRCCSLGSIKREAKTIFWEDVIFVFSWPQFVRSGSVSVQIRSCTKVLCSNFSCADRPASCRGRECCENFQAKSESVQVKALQTLISRKKSESVQVKSLACSLQQEKSESVQVKALHAQISEAKVKGNAWTCIARSLQPGSTLKYWKKKSEIIIKSLKSF